MAKTTATEKQDTEDKSLYSGRTGRVHSHDLIKKYMYMYNDL